MTSLRFTESELMKSDQIDMLDRFQLINSQIENRERLVSVLQEESELLSDQIASNQEQITYLDGRMSQHKQEYIEVLKISYRDKLVKNDWLYLLSAESLNKAILRYHYLNKIKEYAVKESKSIRELNTRISDTKDLLTQQLIKVNQNKKTEERIIEQLRSEQESKQKIISKLKKDKAKVASKYKVRSKVKTKSLNLRADRYSVNTSGTTVSNDNSALTAFEQARRRLNWPVENGVIVEKFGRHPHEAVPSIWIENNGVGIRTAPGENVKAVFDGVVKQIPRIDNNGYLVVIEHGEYLTSYFSIANIFVSKGDRVSEGQILGQVSKSATVTPILNFEVWKGFDKLNPQHWLSKR